MKFTLRDENGVMKLKINEDMINHLFPNRDLLKVADMQNKKFKDGISRNCFVFHTDLVVNTPIGQIYFWKNDYLSQENC